MITKVSHVSLYVKDQEAALQFYRDALGFNVKDDVTMDNGFRWITVTPPQQPDLAIALMALKPFPPRITEEDVEALRKLQDRGLLSGGVLETTDCRKTYEVLKARGVEFTAPPEEKFYGIEAIMKDNSGNWFSMTQRTE